jgi:DNA-binding transcriptional ArsR family regulator
VILGQRRAGVRTSSKNFEVTIQWRLGHGLGSVPGRAANGLVSSARQAHGRYMGETGMTGTTSAPRPGYEQRAGAPDALAVSVVLAPQQSVITLLLQAASGRSLGVPADVLAAVRDGLRPQARFAAQSFATRGWSRLPESCTPISPLVDASVADQVARMRDMHADELVRDLESADGCLRWAPHWRAAADQPRRWLNSMADASLDTWAVAEPRWQAAGPLLDREIRRVGTAAVRGGMAALLNSLHPGIRYHDGTFTFTAQCRKSEPIGPIGPIGSRRLALLPLVVGRNAVMFSFERPDVCYIGYPVAPPRPGAEATADSALATILGPVRAAILQALRQPLTVNDVAAAVHCAPTTATYHLHQLAAAGLITREKSGPAVWVSRAARGDELVGLLSD